MPSPPPPPYRQRTIDAPDGEWFDEIQCAGFLRYDLSDFMERLSMGLIPAGSPIDRRNHYQWSWQQLWAMSIMRPWIDQRYIDEKKAEAERKKAARGSKSSQDDETED